VKSLPPQQTNSQSTIKRTSLTPNMNGDLTKIFQCKYCSFTSNWSKDITRHQREIHPNYPPHILQKEYLHQDNEINNNEEEVEEEDEGISALLIDPVRAFGEVIDTNEEEEEEEEMTVENDIEDDEEEA
jgi:hypothetical protein